MILSAFILVLTLVAALAPEYDFIVVGGGVSGLVVANRLSGDPSVSVLVIEAGPSVLDNVNVTDVDAYSRAFGTEIDWQFISEPQLFGGEAQILRAGRALGGGSTINVMAYVRAEDVQLDAWQSIGNDGWNWTSLFPYYLQSENLTLPTAAQTEAGATYDASVHGSRGPLKVAFPHMQRGGNDLTPAVNRTLLSAGIPWNVDVNAGRMRGFSIYPWTIDEEAYIRHDAARAYFWPFESRSNLHAWLNTGVNRIVWREGPGGENISAAGVEVTAQNGTVSVVMARREVILSAGALKSPTILELSGVGNPRILNRHNIPVRVSLPAVRENLQDQMNTLMTASTHSPITGGRTVTFASATDIFSEDTSSLANLTRIRLPSYAAVVANMSNGAMLPGHLQHLFQVQHDLIFKNNIPIAEIIFKPGGEKTVNAGYWGLQPFARGEVHIRSSDPTAQPTINPNYGLLEWNVQLQVAIAKFIRRMFRSAPLEGMIEKELRPGLSAVPGDAADEVWANWLKDNYASNFHAIGTAAMMPRSLGGVVNNRLQVYGTANVRVVDASIHPFQLCGHPMANLYAIADRAADLIKEDWMAQGAETGSGEDNEAFSYEMQHDL
ncbi:glucose oxidase [Aspergillus udagawae]|uniref:glucose oxidase n=1 Tax=Aspergillus udagawae TaxID=91492 RepID=A0A8H3P7P7_9EURO|nr:glucose oxidase [Aspergillus udagawae]